MTLRFLCFVNPTNLFTTQEKTCNTYNTYNFNVSLCYIYTTETNNFTLQIILGFGCNFGFGFLSLLSRLLKFELKIIFFEIFNHSRNLQFQKKKKATNFATLINFTNAFMYNVTHSLQRSLYYVKSCNNYY